MNRYMRTRILSATLVAAVAFTSMQPVLASSITDAKNKKNEAESGLSSAQNSISSIESQQSELQTEIDALDSELVTIILNMDMLKGELEDKEVQLDQVNADLKVAQENETAQYNAMKSRIQFMYEKGDTSFLTAILGAESFADLLNRVEYATDVYDYDRKLLTTYQETKKQVADLKTQVEGEKAELEEMQAEYAVQKSDYETMIASKQASMADFDSQLADARELASQYQSTIDAQNAVIKEEEDKKAAADAAAAQAAANQGASSSSNNKGNSTSKGDGSTDKDSGANPSYSTSVSGSDVVSYAQQFIGNPYVAGGVSLTDGADCSGFVMSVYAHFGISLPHSSAALQGCGKAVSYANAQPGDLICYAGHVGIYIGGGQIVNASSSAPYPIGGIKTQSATYRSFISVRRVL